MMSRQSALNIWYWCMRDTCLMDGRIEKRGLIREHVVAVQWRMVEVVIHMKDLTTLLLEHLAGRFDRTAEILSCEWGVGNGQCPVCYGLSPNVKWGPFSRRTGHEDDCLFEYVIKALRSSKRIEPTALLAEE